MYADLNFLIGCEFTLLEEKTHNFKKGDPKFTFHILTKGEIKGFMLLENEKLFILFRGKTSKKEEFISSFIIDSRDIQTNLFCPKGYRKRPATKNEMMLVLRNKK